MNANEMTNNALKSEFEEAGWAMESCRVGSIAYDINKAVYDEYKAELVRRGFRVDI